MGEKEWLTLNQHGKYCLITFLYCISGTDILTSQMDYLYSKGLIQHINGVSDYKDREEIASHCLTDLGMHTAKHYFPEFTNWGKKQFFTQTTTPSLPGDNNKK